MKLLLGFGATGCPRGLGFRLLGFKGLVLNYRKAKP